MHTFAKALAALLLLVSSPASATLPTGSVYIAGTGGTCGSTAIATTSCRLATVSCKGLWDPEANRSFSIDDRTASLKVTDPSGAVVGTLITQQGGSGSGSVEAPANGTTGFVSPALAAGYRVVQVMWTTIASDQGMWQGSPSSSSYGGDSTPDGPLDLACRFATLSKAICDDTTLHAAGTPCVAHGQSGGSSAVTYALTRYGASDWLDGALLTGGPPIGDLERACNGATLPGWATACASLRAVSPSGLCHYTNAATSGQFTDLTWADGRVGCALQSAVHAPLTQGLRYSSALGGQARRRHPYTTIRALYGDADASEAVPLGRYVVQQLIDSTGATPANVISTGASAPHAILEASASAAGLATMLLGGTYLGVTYPAITRMRPDLSAQWSPLALPGLELYLTAESTAHLWQETAGQPLTHAVATTNPIGTIDDMSPSAHTLTAPSSGTRPTLTTGGLAFASSALTVASSLDAFRSLYWLGTGAIVGRLSFASDGSAMTLLDSNGGSTSASGVLLERSASNHLRIQVTKGTGSAVFDYTMSASALAADGEQTLVVVLGAGGGGFIQWGSTVETFTRTSAPVGSGQAASLLSIGRRADASNAFAGTIRHLAIFSRVPTAGDRASLAAWAPTRSSSSLVSWVGPDRGYFSGLSAAYDLTDATTVFADTAGTTPISASAGVALVRSSLDRDGHLGRDLSQATAGSRPTWSSGGQTGLGAVFDGSTDYLDLGADWPASGAQTMLLVVRQDHASTGSPVLGGNIGEDNYTWLGGPSYTNWTLYPTGNAPTEMIVPLVHSAAGTWSILEVVRDGSAWTLRSLGGSPVTYTDSTTWVQRYLGRYSTFRLSGAVRALFLWRVALDADQLARVRQHLCGRFAGAC